MLVVDCTFWKHFEYHKVSTQVFRALGGMSIIIITPSILYTVNMQTQMPSLYCSKFCELFFNISSSEPKDA